MFGRQHGSGSGSSWLHDSGWGGGFGFDEERQQAAPSSYSFGAVHPRDSFYAASSSWGWDEPAASGAQQQQAHAEAEEAGAAPEQACSSNPWPLQLKSSQKSVKFKSLTRMSKGEATATGAAPSSSSASSSAPAAPASAASTSPFLKPIRFVKSKLVLHMQPDEKGGSSDAAPPPGSVQKQGGRVSLLTPRPAAATTASSKPPKSVSPLKAAPPLLVPFKKPVTESSQATAALSSVSYAGGGSSSSGGSHSTLQLAAVFTCSYSLAGRKKRQHRDGYLHLFKSALSSTNAAATAAAAELEGSESAPVDPPAPSAASDVTFLKSHLYSERGVLLDEQIGKSVMQFEEQAQRPKRPRDRGTQQPFGGGGLWDQDPAAGGAKGKKRRRGDEASSSDEESSDGDGGGGIDPPRTWASAAEAAAPPHPLGSADTPVLQRNIFRAGESVTLGRYECQLEEEIDKETFDKATKIMTGEISSAPLSRFSSKTSCTILGSPLPADNVGFRLLCKSSPLPDKIKEPIALVWRAQDSKPGIGFKERPRIPPASRVHGRGGRTR